MRYAGVIAEGRQVQLLPGPAGAELEEPGKGLEIADIDDLAHIPLDIGRGVVGQPLMGGDVSIINPGIGALPEKRKEIGRRIGKSVEFFEAGWQKRQDAAPAGKGLGDGLRQAEMLGTGQYEASRIGAIIHVALQIIEQFRGMLDFIDDDVMVIFGEKTTRVISGEIPAVEGFQGYIAAFGPGCPAQGGLARLPGPRDHDHRIVSGQFLQFLFQGALYHDGQNGMGCIDCQFDLQIMKKASREFHPKESAPKRGISWPLPPPPVCIPGCGGRRTEGRLETSSAVSDFRTPTSDFRLLTVGFNRRFSPHIQALRKVLGPEPDPMHLTATMNAGAVPADSWVKDPAVGGGRVIGEAWVAVVDNFRRTEAFGFAGFRGLKTRIDKGYAAQFRLLCERLRSGGEALIPFAEIENATRASFACIESLMGEEWVEIYNSGFGNEKVETEPLQSGHC